MLKRVYIHNFRCFQNFEFKLGDVSSALFLGKNGTGKSTLIRAFTIIQSIGRGVNRAGQLIKPSDFTLGRTQEPIRFELELSLHGMAYRYTLVFDLPERFKEVRVFEEKLEVDGKLVYLRDLAEVTVHRENAGQPEAKFSMDWHLVALPVIHQNPSSNNALSQLRNWMAQMVLLAPIPLLMKTETIEDTLEPHETAENLTDWLAGVLAQYPAAYTTISNHLQQVMPDLFGFRFDKTGKDSKVLLLNFKDGQQTHDIEFNALSDGEKCFCVCAVLLAANQCYGPLFAIWDEPDNFLSLSEVGHFVMELRRNFEHHGGQIWMASHNEETIRRFSLDNTWVLSRSSHLAPTTIRSLSELNLNKGLIETLIIGEDL